MTKKAPENFYDVVVIGGGPAGLTAALYLARARYRVLVLERGQFGGQITITSEIVNYPGVGVVSGTDLTDTMRRQAEAFGAAFLQAEATELLLDGDVKTVRTTKGDLQCFGILAATGARPRKVGFDGEEQFQGHGVAYCATCDGEFFTDKEVFVIGGGFAAAEESVFLTKYAKHVTLLIREPDFTCARAVADRARQHEKISIHYETVVESASGDSVLRTIRWRNLTTGKVTEYHAEAGDTFGVFVFAGYAPETSLLPDAVQRNTQGYVLTGRDGSTHVAGLYAAGDLCEKDLRQVVTAVSDGASAAAALEKYAAAMQQKTGIIPQMPTRTAYQSENTSVPGETLENKSKSADTLFSEEMLAQLDAAFARMQQPLVLRLYLDETSASQELRLYMETLATRTERLSLVQANDSEEEPFRPCVRIFHADGTTPTGLAFHGVPGGHEFTSFVLGLLHAAGAGKPLEPQEQIAIERLSKSNQLQIFVTLSCTLCPELVASAQRLAAESPLVTAEVYELSRFPALRDKYQIMSVPCLVVDGGKPFFGKKNLRQLLEILTVKT